MLSASSWASLRAGWLRSMWQVGGHSAPKLEVMSASTGPNGIVGYVSGVDASMQRERIVTALERVGLTAIEIVEENPVPNVMGRAGLARIYEYARRSDVDSIVVASFDALFNDDARRDRWRREMAFKFGVRVVQIEKP